MAKRAGIRKVVKWGGLAVSVLVAVAWVGSAWYWAMWRTPDVGAIAVSSGAIAMMEPLWPLGLSGGGRYTFKPFDGKMAWWFTWGQSTGGWYVQVPLWAPLLIVAGATAAAWRADARARRLARVNACPACGYDRRGLDAGKVCPECGAASRGESVAKPDA